MATVATTIAQNAHGGSTAQLGAGTMTKCIYSFIAAGQFAKAIEALTEQLQNHGTSRAALSLLAYCHYSTQSFAKAAE
jgi:tetratricopeptide repeat protein 30